MKKLILCLCGHTQEHELQYGDPEKDFLLEEWIKSRVCLDCYLLQKAKEEGTQLFHGK